MAYRGVSEGTLRWLAEGMRGRADELTPDALERLNRYTQELAARENSGTKGPSRATSRRYRSGDL